jgi:hypothetical protein
VPGRFLGQPCLKTWITIALLMDGTLVRYPEEMRDKRKESSRRHHMDMGKLRSIRRRKNTERGRKRQASRVRGTRREREARRTVAARR